MPTRTLAYLLTPELAFPGHHRKHAERVGEAVADLDGETRRQFAHLEPCAAAVKVTLYARDPASVRPWDGKWRPRTPHHVAMGTYPIFTALSGLGVHVFGAAFEVRHVVRAEDERIEVTVMEVTEEEAAA